MIVSELLAALQRVQQVAGDIPIILRHLESDAVTDLRSLGVHITAGSGSDGGRVELEHAPVPATSTPPAPAAAPDVGTGGGA